jgi:uncharacterized protein (TIGR02147 family)
MKNVHAFKSYPPYLSQALAKDGPFRRADLCAHLNCQASFLSQVISGKSHLSLEHAVLVSEFLGHTPEEKKFFLLLVQKAKAGSKKLEAFFGEQIQAELESREPVKELIGVKGELSEESKAIYYSQWYYVAIHILVAFPEYQSFDHLKRKTGLPEEILREALKFLIKHEFVTQNDHRYQIGKARTHLGSKSPHVSRHHSNWRTKGLEAIERRRPDDLHYTAFLGVSRKGAEQIRELIMEFLRSSEEVVETTKEEAPYLLLLDFFEFAP